MILAGGHSRRMGQDKALLKLPDGQQLLSRTAQIAQQLTADVVVVTPWPDRYRTMLPPSIRWVTESPMPPQSPSLQKPRYLGASERLCTRLGTDRVRMVFAASL